MLTRVRAALALPLAAAVACSTATVATTTVPDVSAPAATPTTLPPPLPPIPAVDGPLAIRVVYPTANQVVTSKDSNFIFGSIGSGRASLTVNGVPARVYPNGAFMVYLANPPGDTPSYQLVAARGSDTARASHLIRYPAKPTVAAVAPPAAPSAKPEALATSRADTIAALHARLDSLRGQLARDEPIGWVQLGQPSAGADTDRVIIGRPTPGGTYKWFFAPGTIVPLLGRADGMAHIRLDHDLDVYVDSADALPLPGDTPAPRRVLSNMRVRGAPLGVEVVIPIGPRAPYLVEETDRAIVLTLYGVRGNTDVINFAPNDSMVRTVEWVQETADRVRVTVNLRAAPYGYLVQYESNAVVLRLRGRPAIDAGHPLRGLTLVVDPGHPPIGATGPTGLWEPQATLPIGVRLKRILEERGAAVVMTRTTDSAVALTDRPIIARRANANAFVSIHLNAYPDGVNPFIAPGTGTYYFRTHSEPFARYVQRGMVSQLGLIDLGVNYDNLAVVRSTWYPAVLCEGAFVILPDQEAALRTPEFQERYARGVADGVENYFRSLPAR
ncbi:MAG: N-acetylmuramoyl-L-alanine amidase [Gemmatimonadota bacterium]|nr:N-acetylmuramoyl-L-alanine amidase [Gemmatimonadota bacterium]